MVTLKVIILVRDSSGARKICQNGKYLKSENTSTFRKIRQIFRVPSDGGGSSTDQWVIIVEIFRHAPNATPDRDSARVGRRGSGWAS